MSKLIKNTKTPKIVRGLEIDEHLKHKIRETKQKVLGLEIVVEDIEYDSQGKQIRNEVDEDEEEYNDVFEGIFNAHLLDEEYLDQQPYEGETSFSQESDRQSAVQTVPPVYQPRDEEEIKEDLKKHLNIDFNEDNDNDDESIDADDHFQYIGQERQRGASLAAIEH